MVYNDNRVHIRATEPTLGVSTFDPNKILRELADKPKPLDSAVQAAFGGVGRQSILELIIAYCNGVEVGVTDGDRPLAVAEEFGIGYTSVHGLDRLAFLFLQIDRSLHLDPDTGELTRAQERSIRSTAEELKRERAKFRSSVMWLCSPKPQPIPALSSRKRAQLLKTGKLYWGRYPMIDREAENFVRYFEDHGLRHFKMKASLQQGRLSLFPNCLHFVDLLCAFLLDECHGKDPTAMPVKICRRCSQLFASQRKDADFCSDKCRTKSFWTDERKRDYMYVDRLEDFANKCLAQKHNFSLEDLRDKLSSPKSEARLRDIEARWPDWAKLIDKVKQIRAMIVPREPARSTSDPAPDAGLPDQNRFQGPRADR